MELATEKSPAAQESTRQRAVSRTPNSFRSRSGAAGGRERSSVKVLIAVMIDWKANE